MITFTAEQVAAMDKAQCKALLSKFDGMLDAATKKLLTARIEQLDKPADPTPFPRQSELTDAWSQWKYWGGEIKELVAEARKGNHTYVVDPKEGVKGKRAPRTTRQPRKSKSSEVRTVMTLTVKTEDGEEHASFRAAAEHLGLTAGLTAEKVSATSWRRYIKDPITVKFVDGEMFRAFRDRMADGAAGKLPNWAGMENFTLVSPDGETWKL